MNTQPTAINHELRINYRFNPQIGAFTVNAGDRVITTAPHYLACDETASAILATLSEIRESLDKLINGIQPNPDTGNLDALYNGVVIATGDHTDYTRLLCALSDARIRDLRQRATMSATSERILPDYETLKTAHQNDELPQLLAPYSTDDLKAITTNYIRERKKRDGVAMPFTDMYRWFTSVAQRAA